MIAAMPQPQITVLMPVYNGAVYLRPALESILTQTFDDFELLIIDDGSSDDSLAICQSYSDARIRLVENGTNLGLIATLNKGLAMAQGKYIARMDCDDISLPRRLERQYEFMEQNPDIGICGSWYIQREGSKHSIMKPPVDDAVLRVVLTMGNPFIHSTMMLRRSLLEDYQLRYDFGYRHAEDYEFWVRCGRYAKMANLAEILLEYRWHADNISHRFRHGQGVSADQVRVYQLEMLGIMPTPDELALHQAMAKFEFSGDRESLKQAGEWLHRLVAQACQAHVLETSKVYPYLARYWYGACAYRPDWRIWRIFQNSAIGRAAEWSWQLKMLWRCLLRRGINVS